MQNISDARGYTSISNENIAYVEIHVLANFSGTNYKAGWDVNTFFFSSNEWDVGVSDNMHGVSDTKNVIYPGASDFQSQSCQPRFAPHDIG